MLSEKRLKMSRYYDRYDDYGFPPYVPVGEKKKRNQQSLARARIKNSNIQPVIIEGRNIAGTWWGKSWNENLERYADYSNRIGRGKSYVRHGAVLDLKISPGIVTALVQGSRAKPYQVEIKIDKLSDEVWNNLKKESLHQLESLSELLSGKFPQSLQEAFFARQEGIFPSPKEISFDCSCPDWASMCKHVASALYGIGNRLDCQPELLFKLRQVSIDELVDKAVQASTKKLMDKAAGADESGIIADGDLEDVFGIAMDDAVNPGIKSSSKSSAKLISSRRKKGERKKKATAKPLSQVAEKVRKKPKKVKRAESKTGTKSLPKSGKMIDQLCKAALKLKRKFTIPQISSKLDSWDSTRINNTLQRAIKDGRIKRVERGIYALTSRK